MSEALLFHRQLWSLGVYLESLVRYWLENQQGFFSWASHPNNHVSEAFVSHLHGPKTQSTPNAAVVINYNVLQYQNTKYLDG